MTMILAQMSEVPWWIVGMVALGLIGLLSIYVLIMQAVAVTRKNFGKQPPMQEQITKLRDEFVKEMARHEADVKQAMAEHDQDDAEEFKRIEGKIDGVDRDVRKLREDINANGEIRKQTMLNHIDTVRRELKADITHAADKQTELLLKAIKR